MIHIGSFDIKTEIFVLLVSLVLLSVQLLLCFKAKRLWVRLIPFGLFAGVTAILILGVFFRVYNGLVLFAYATDSGFLALICACGWAIWWIVDSLIAFVRKSTKKQVVTLFSVIASALLIVVTAVSLFKYNYPTYYPYKDREIIGCTPEEIEAKYGEFWALYRNEENVPTAAEYMIREDYTDYLGNDDSLSYYIVFKDGVAVRVRLQKGRPGG